MERTIRGRIDQKGRIAIPASFREALGIRDGGEVIVQLRNDELSITTQQLRIRRAQQRARKYLQPGVSLADELLVERREEMER